jgi:hypothetical protein
MYIILCICTSEYAIANMEGREYNLMLKCTDDAMLLTFTTLVENFGCGNFLGQLNEFTSSPFVPRDLSFLLGL